MVGWLARVTRPWVSMGLRAQQHVPVPPPGLGAATGCFGPTWVFDSVSPYGGNAALGFGAGADCGAGCGCPLLGGSLRGGGLS